MAKIYFSLDLDPQDIRAIGDVVNSTLDKVVSLEDKLLSTEDKECCNKETKDKVGEVKSLLTSISKLAMDKLAKADINLKQSNEHMCRENKVNVCNNTKGNNNVPNTPKPNNCKVKKK